MAQGSVKMDKCDCLNMCGDDPRLDPKNKGDKVKPCAQWVRDQAAIKERQGVVDLAPHAHHDRPVAGEELLLMLRGQAADGRIDALFVGIVNMRVAREVGSLHGPPGALRDLDRSVEHGVERAPGQVA